MYKEANNHRDKMRYVFSNIDKIYTGAQIFQNELKDLLDALEIADLFIKHVIFFSKDICIDIYLILFCRKNISPCMKIT